MDFISKYSNGKSVSAAQYLVEFICERLAKVKKKDLHYRFWLSPEWEKEYKGQVGAANKLLKKYDIRQILAALKSDRGSKIYSLRAPHLTGIIDKTKIPNDDQTVVKKQIDRSNSSVGKTEVKSKNILDKLKEIDNGA